MLLGNLNVFSTIEELDLWAFSDFFPFLTEWSFIELCYSLYPSSSIASEAVTFQTVLVLLSAKVGDTFFYLFNLIQGFSSHLALDAIDKNPRVSKVLLEKNLELLPGYWYNLILLSLILDPLLDDFSIWKKYDKRY